MPQARHNDHDAQAHLSEAHLSEAVPAEDRRTPHWEITLGDGPVIATAIHDGHTVRDSLRQWMAISEADRRREEDPLTGVLTTVGDVQVRVHASRFQCDLNRPRDLAISTNPADTWDLEVWQTAPPQSELDQSLAYYDRFYTTIGTLVDATIARWGCVLLLDIHSYNHRRDGPGAAPADPAANPEIDLGVTTLDPARFGDAVARFARELRATKVAGRNPDVRENVRYEGGGHFPEWLHATYGDRVCAISLEYKKVYMDEWTAQADIAMVEDLRAGLRHAVDAVRGEFLRCH
ncbi:N-formylglutamate amidohydrolase [Lysobacter sp. D1-1-M9]|uniref:N-formylglutamate amidohydrolase n=1 Tax=Novilysobacter longmucuonensis TaxID=3098603 RepID=UPI002FCCB715